MLIFGTRPEAIKLAPLIQALKTHSEEFVTRVCVTGQHREMLDQVLRAFAINPDCDLAIMRPRQTLCNLTARLLTELDHVLQREAPDWVFVQGDTTTTMAASLAAYYRQIAIAHVEAGLRSYDPRRPFPEETNRRVTAAVATLHLAPTRGARDNLLREGIPEHRIRVTGNTGVDALVQIAAQDYDFSRSPLAGLLSPDRRLIVVTSHRRESFGKPLQNICAAISALAARYRNEVQIVFPVHLNPNVRGPVHRALSDHANVVMMDPLDYVAFVHLMKRAALIITDSGGIQEEAPVLGVPVLVIREVTERPEGVAAGAAQIIGTLAEDIISAARQLLDDETVRSVMADNRWVYGDGHASKRILLALREFERGRAATSSAAQLDSHELPDCCTTRH